MNALLIRNWRIVAAAIAVLSFGLWLALHDRAVVKNHDARIEASAAAARDQAAGERVADAVSNTQAEQERIHAINTAPSGGALSPAAHALACERLRQLGRVPAACGSASGNGGQAGAR